MKGLLKYTTLVVMAAIVLVTSTGCNRTKSRLPGVWRLERLKTSSLPYEYWIFEDGTVSICKFQNGQGKTGQSSYVAKNSKIIMDTWNNDYKYYNGNWRIIDIDDDILRIANFDNGGMLTREFVKVE